MKHIGYWWADNNIEMVEINGSVYALYGWNGDRYTKCWKCFGKYYMDASKEIYELLPVYNCVGEDEYEIVDYIVRRV